VRYHVKRKRFGHRAYRAGRRDRVSARKCCGGAFETLCVSRVSRGCLATGLITSRWLARVCCSLLNFWSHSWQPRSPCRQHFGAWCLEGETFVRVRRCRKERTARLRRQSRGSGRQASVRRRSGWRESLPQQIGRLLIPVAVDDRPCGYRRGQTPRFSIVMRASVAP